MNRKNPSRTLRSPDKDSFEIVKYSEKCKNTMRGCFLQVCQTKIFLFYLHQFELTANLGCSQNFIFLLSCLVNTCLFS